MRIISSDKISSFIKKHADAYNALTAWREETEKAKWKSPQDVKDFFPSASILAENRVIFNIKGNHYRLTVQIAYKNSVVAILHIETHAEYSKRLKSSD